MISEVPTSALLVDVNVYEANAVRMADRAATLGVALRPHAKTVKSPALLRSVIGLGAKGLTVSTLGELRSLLPLTADFMYGVPVAEGKAGRVLEAIGSHDVRLSVVVGDVGNLDGVPRDSRVDVVMGDRFGRSPGRNPAGRPSVGAASRSDRVTASVAGRDDACQRLVSGRSGGGGFDCSQRALGSHCCGRTVAGRRS